MLARGFTMKLSKWNARCSPMLLLCLQVRHCALPLHPIVRECVIHICTISIYSARKISSLSINESFSWALCINADCDRDQY